MLGRNGPGLSGSALLLAVGSGAAGQVIPSGPAVGFEAVPFGTNQSACLHEVFASSVFTGASGGNSVRITSISLAPSTNESYSVIVAIRLGYTNAVPGVSGASRLQPPTSVSGGGAPNAVGAMALFLPSANRSYTITSSSPTNFQMAFPGQAFTYDPALGNLLVEFVTTVQVGGVPVWNEGVAYAAGGPDASLAYNSTAHGAAAEPTQAVRMDFAFTTIATGACCFGDGSCHFIAPQTCTTLGGVYSGNNITCAAANCPQPGACCMPDASCVFEFPSACTAAGGVYEGAGVTCAQANCPLPGACCFGGGTCSILLPSQCAAQNGTWNGALTCAAAGCSSCFVVNGGFESGSLSPGWTPDSSSWGVSAAPLPGGSVAPHDGTYAAYLLEVNDGNAVMNSLTQTVPVRAGTRVTISFWFAVGNFATLTVTFDGVPLLGMFPATAWRYYRVDLTPIHDNPVFQFLVFTERAPPGGGTTTGVAYFDDITICTACYANCDGSTIPPVLNVNDFACFLNAYAAGDPYANCDGSTTQPVLNVLDFACFLNQYAAGCS